jgi:RNA polymerase-binding transcription factor DksA
MSINTAYFKKKLLAEKTRIEHDLEEVGRINPENKDDWETVAAPLNIDPAEEEERAEEITDFEDRSAIEFELEKKLNQITAALEHIDQGTYGICSVCTNAIEEDRLEANYSANTCKAHMG